MTKMHNNILPWFALAGLALTLGGCGNSTAAPAKPKPQAAALTFFVDSSGSTAFIGSPDYANAAIVRAGQSVMRQRLGDHVRIVGFGDRRAENSIDIFSESSGYNNRPPTVRKHVEAALHRLIESNRASGGQGGTNIIYSLEATHPICTPGSHVKIFSDGIAEDERYSAARALDAGKPVHLPPPATPLPLWGCHVEMIGIGMVSTGAGQAAQSLPNDRMQRLIAGWREYLAAAGVSPQDMVFTSVL